MGHLGIAVSKHHFAGLEVLLLLLKLLGAGGLPLLKDRQLALRLVTTLLGGRGAGQHRLMCPQGLAGLLPTLRGGGLSRAPSRPGGCIGLKPPSDYPHALPCKALVRILEVGSELVKCVLGFVQGA